jgi:uncharacterized protein (DUF1499 family)
MIPAWLAFFDGLLALALALAGIVAAHYGLTAPFIGFSLVLGAGVLGIFGLVAGVIGFFRTASPARRSGRPRAIIGLVLSLVIVAPLLGIFLTHKQYPPINDITTDTQNPPEFVKAQEIPANHAREMKYDSAKYAAVQTGAPVYKDLAPLKVGGAPDDVFKKAEIIAGEVPNWRITFTDPSKRTMEGVATSAIFHFTDDWVVEVRPAEVGGSLVEMRSKSRDGVGDLGVNYHRIESFFRLLQGPPRGAAGSREDAPP